MIHFGDRVRHKTRGTSMLVVDVPCAYIADTSLVKVAVAYPVLVDGKYGIREDQIEARMLQSATP